MMMKEKITQRSSRAAFICSCRVTRNKNGETLIETLAAVLVSSLAMLVLATMILTSSKMTDNSSKQLDKYYAANNTLGAGGDTETKGTVSLKDEDGDPLAFGPEDVTVAVDCYENAEAGKVPVLSYKKSAD